MEAGISGGGWLWSFEGLEYRGGERDWVGCWWCVCLRGWGLGLDACAGESAGFG